MGPLIVIVIRLLAPLLILKRPLIGGLLSMLLDATDFLFFQYFGWGFLAGPGFEYASLGAHLDNYQLLDKLLDTYYLSLEAFTVRYWRDPGARVVCYTLFAWRLIGTALFLYLPYEYLLLMFPNLFESVFLLFLIFKQHLALEPVRLLLIFGVAILHKLLQEYTLHILPIDYSSIVRELQSVLARLVMFTS